MRERGRPLDPDVHPTNPKRVVAWHAMMLGRQQARKTWRLLARHILFELRECPVCNDVTLRWRRLDELKQRIFLMAIRAAGGNVTLAARRLKITRGTIYDSLPPKWRGRVAEIGRQGGPARAANRRAPAPKEGGA